MPVNVNGITQPLYPHEKEEVKGYFKVFVGNRKFCKVHEKVLAFFVKMWDDKSVKFHGTQHGKEGAGIMQEKVTMTKIAKACGTSIGTVDRALNNRPGINQETKRQILETARSMGYQSNRIAGALSRKNPKRIAMLDYRQESDFHSVLLQGAKRAGNDLADYGVRVDLYAAERMSLPEQLDQLRLVEREGYDGVVVNSLGSEVDEEINRLVRMGVPVVTCNTDSPDSLRLFYVGCDAGCAGRLSGELAGKLMDGRGSVGAIGNFVRKNAFVQRFAGFCRIVRQDYPGIALRTWAGSYMDEFQAQEEIARILEEWKDLSLLHVTDYSGTVGAIRALEAAGRQDVRLLGYDLSAQTFQALQQGRCTAVLYQDPYQQGFQAVSLLARHLLDGWRPEQPHLWITPQIVMKYNADLYGTHGPVTPF